MNDKEKTPRQKVIDIVDAHDNAQDAAANIKVENDGVKLMRDIFPSNAHTKREEKRDESKKVEKVINGNAVIKKKSLGKRLFETFVGEDIHTVSSYILHDVLIPAAKDTLYDMVKGSLEMSLFGEKKGTRTRRESGKSYVSYNNFSNRDRRDERRDISPRDRAMHNFEDIALSSRGDAEEVLSNLVDLIDEYNQATVADLYELIGITGNFTDNKYGWTNLSSASVSRTRDGYVLNLPKAIYLD